MKTFCHLLINALISSAKNAFVWFALTYWIYLETQSVISTGLVGGMYLVCSALTGFLIGSMAQYIFIPFMTTGRGVGLMGNWFGVGTGRGIALVFICAGVIGFTVTQVARRSSSYVLLAEKYNEE